MIDIHNHILINLDDGPKNHDDMMRLLRQASEQGIKGIVASPHHLHYNFNNDFDSIEKKVNNLNEKEEINELGIRIYPGQEIRISEKLISDIDSGKIKGINHSKYLLVELPSNRVPNYTNNIIYEIQTRGFIPVIVHPERNKEIANNISLLFGLISIGALSQITASSLIGTFGKNIQKSTIKMIEYNLVHFIASDSHHSEQRPFCLGKLFDVPKLQKYQNNISELILNNEKVIKDDEIHIKRPIEPKKRKIFGFF